MMTPIPLFLLLISALALPGCSSLDYAIVPGEVQSISVQPDGRVKEPFQIRATARFQGAYTAPILTLTYPDDPSKPLRIRASARTPEPFLNLSIFPLDTQTIHQEDLALTVTFWNPGTYTIESIPIETGQAIVKIPPFDIR